MKSGLSCCLFSELVNVVDNLWPTSVIKSSNDRGLILRVTISNWAKVPAATVRRQIQKQGFNRRKTPNVRTSLPICPHNITTTVGVCNILSPGGQSWGTWSRFIYSSHGKTLAYLTDVSPCAYYTYCNLWWTSSLLPGNSCPLTKKNTISTTWMMNTLIWAMYKVLALPPLCWTVGLCWAKIIHRKLCNPPSPVNWLICDDLPDARREDDSNKLLHKPWTSAVLVLDQKCWKCTAYKSRFTGSQTM